MGETVANQSEDQITCPRCGHEMRIGEYPFCPHLGVRGREAVQGDPTVIFYNPATGKYRFPGSSDAPTPSGYERQVLTTDRERAAMEKKMNAEESAKLRQHWYERQQERQRIMGEGAEKLRERYQVASPSERRIIDAAFGRMARESERAGYEMPKDAGFQIRVRHFDGGRWDD